MDAFLAQYCETSMFLRGNLADQGLGDSDHPNATVFHIWEENQEVAGVFGRSNDGFLMAQIPDLNRDAIIAWAQTLSGHNVVGITGDAKQVPVILDVLGFDDNDWKIDKDEPLFSLDLSQLNAPEPVGILRAVVPSDAKFLHAWFEHYELDTGLVTEFTEDARKRVKMVVERAIETDYVRILERDGTPCATTSFNARLPDIVQIGGVFVPRHLRNQGYGRAVVAAHLIEARGRGVSRAVLFANNHAAVRAYEAIGFSRIGSYRINLLETPRVFAQP